MPFPKKRKNDIDVFGDRRVKSPTENRQALQDRITAKDVYLPDSILHDDLDSGMLEFVKDKFKVVSDGEQIPIIPKILTVQRWGEYTANWEFSDGDGNVKLPFIAIIRKPDVQPGTNPITQRTIPDSRAFHYATVPTWNGNQRGADIYKIPQPVAIDISFEITIVCTKFRDLNVFNKKMLSEFASRQAYTTVKGHYVPIILERVEDNTPMESLDGRRFYIQNYSLVMLGFLIDSDDFEVKPAINRMFLLNEFIRNNNYTKKYVNKSIEITIGSFKADGMQTAFSVGETINILFSVSINGIIQTRDVHYFHVAGTSKIAFPEPPWQGSTITITYHKGRNDRFMDTFGKPIQVATEYFNYDGENVVFTTLNSIDSVISLDINGLVEEDGVGFEVAGTNEVKLKFKPAKGSKVGIIYLH
jgi:hypothetical protein